MKALLLLPFALGLSLSTLDAQTTPTLLSQAQRDYAAGNLDEAKIKFQQVLAENPRNSVASNFLKQIEAAERQSGGTRRMEAQLKAMIIPNVELNEASLDSTLDYLRKQAEKLSEGQTKINFVVHTGVNREAPVTLKLANIPFTEVLRYVGSLAKVRFATEQYAIAVYPTGEPSAAPAPEAPEAPAP